MELALATAAQAFARDAVTYESWGQPQLTIDEYLRREEHLRMTAWSRSNLRPWVLLENGEVVASCETYAMDSRVGTTAGLTHGVASVFVERRFRGLRFASQMMRLLVQQLRTEGAHALKTIAAIEPSLLDQKFYLATRKAG